MVRLTNVSEELILLSKELVETIEREDMEYEFKKNKGYIQRNISASKFKNNFVGLRSTDFDKVISTKD